MFETKTAHKIKLHVVTKKGKVKKYGAVRNVVFHPSKPRAVGYIIKRPDLLWMIKRKDRFVALDRVTVTEDGLNVVALDDATAWDRGACKRLDVDFDLCIIWDNMPVRTCDGQEVGCISNVAFDESTHAIDHIELGDGSINRAILGHASIPVERIRGYGDGAIVVDLSAEEVEITGGVAAKAGEAWAKTTHRAGEAQAKTTEAAAEAIEKGAYKTGEALGAAKQKIKDTGITEKAGAAINDGAYKLGQAIGNLTRDDDDDEATPAGTPAKAVTAASAQSEAERAATAAKKQAAAAEEEEAYDAAAKAVGKQLGKTKGMFRAFKDEFDKASKGE